MTGMNPTREKAIDELRGMVLDALGEHDAMVWLFGRAPAAMCGIRTILT
jgi:hypothetical protein